MSRNRLIIRTIWVLAVVVAALILHLKADAQGPKGVGATYTQSDNYEVCEAAQRMGVSWLYNWFESPPVCPGIESVPMVKSFDKVGVKLGGSSLYLLGPNEPDVFSQSWATPEEGAVGWRAMEEAYPNTLLVSPAVMNLPWLRNWYDSYTDTYTATMRIDALAFHCYVWADVESSLKHCQDQSRTAIVIADEWGGIPVWLTEWSYLGVWGQPYNYDDAVLYMQLMRMWLASQPRIERQAHFELAVVGDEPWLIAGIDSSLVSYHTGETTALGRAYAREIHRAFLPITRR